MTTPQLARLTDRGVVSVTGDGARAFLDNLITNDMDLLDRQEALHAGLLTPQGKILFAFFVVPVPDGYLLETGRAQVADLLKRLTLYRLRAKVALNDLSDTRAVIATWGGPAPHVPLAVAYADPRAPGLGHRLIVAPEMAAKLSAEDAGTAAYDQHRIALGVPESGRDYLLADAFPHEACFDRMAGVSFTKGCFVGQEVVARMQHKTVVRKRVVRIAAEGTLTEGAEIRLGEASIGRVGTAVGSAGLALLRLDRAAEAKAKDQPLTANGVDIVVDEQALAAYAAEGAARTTPIL